MIWAVAGFRSILPHSDCCFAGLDHFLTRTPLPLNVVRVTPHSTLCTAMSGYAPVETDDEYKRYQHGDAESQALLPTTAVGDPEAITPASKAANPYLLSRTCSHSCLHVFLAFCAGVVACLAVQVIAPQHWFVSRPLQVNSVDADLAPPYVGSTEVHHFPPPSPTNVFPSLFPTNVGHAGGTPTGAEPALIATAPAYPVHTGAPHLVSPSALANSSSGGNFDIFRHWGNLSPWYSVSRGAFGVESGPEAPETCRVTGLHLLHRHGARYPTEWSECSPHAAYVGPDDFCSGLRWTC